MRPRWSFAAFACALLAASATPGLELGGAWHVLVHYTDAASGSREQPDWQDEVWVFESKGGDLRWTVYPIALFDDESARFERDAAGRTGRVPRAWQPNAAQRADIADGLRVDPRGAKRKTLRGSPGEGWSSEPAGASGSASLLTYAEIWRIDGPTERPVFSRTDSLSGAGAEALEGTARYTTRAVRDAGALIEGVFERDGSLRGTFQMRRSGGVEVLWNAAGRARSPLAADGPTP